MGDDSADDWSARTVQGFLDFVLAGAQHTRGVQCHSDGVRSLMTMLPPTILALPARRHSVRGLTQGAVKGSPPPQRR